MNILILTCLNPNETTESNVLFICYSTMCSILKSLHYSSFLVWTYRCDLFSDKHQKTEFKSVFKLWSFTFFSLHYFPMFWYSLPVINKAWFDKEYGHLCLLIITQELIGMLCLCATVWIAYIAATWTVTMTLTLCSRHAFEAPSMWNVLLGVHHWACRLFSLIKNSLPDVPGTLNLSHCRQANIIMWDHRGKNKRLHIYSKVSTTRPIKAVGFAHDTAASSKWAAHNNLVIMGGRILHHKLDSIKGNSSTWIHVQSITLASVYTQPIFCLCLFRNSQIIFLSPEIRY